MAKCLMDLVSKKINNLRDVVAIFCDHVVIFLIGVGGKFTA